MTYLQEIQRTNKIAVDVEEELRLIRASKTFNQIRRREIIAQLEKLGVEYIELCKKELELSKVDDLI